MKNRTPKAKPYRRDVFWPATEKLGRRVVHINLAPEEVSRVQALADRLGLSLDKLIESYVKEPQPMRAYGLKSPVFRIERIAFLPALSDDTMQRLQRAATYYEESPEEFIAGSVISAIEGAEDSMLLHPTTGEFLGEDFLAELLLRDVKLCLGGE